MSPEARAAAIIVSGGSGERFGQPGGKQLANVSGKPVALWALEACAEADVVETIVLVCPEQSAAEFSARVVSAVQTTKPILVVHSGETRQDSVAAGLDAILEDVELVVVHDGARPLLRSESVAELVDAVCARGVDGAVIGHPSIDTLKVVDGNEVVETPLRSRYWAVQTPQVFRRSALVAAHEAARADGFIGTDDASLVEHNGGRVIVVAGPRDNIKVTVPEDLAYVEAVLAHRARESGLESEGPCGSV